MSSRPLWHWLILACLCVVLIFGIVAGIKSCAGKDKVAAPKKEKAQKIAQIEIKEMVPKSGSTVQLHQLPLNELKFELKKEVRDLDLTKVNVQVSNSVGVSGTTTVDGKELIWTPTTSLVAAGQYDIVIDGEAVKKEFSDWFKIAETVVPPVITPPPPGPGMTPQTPGVSERRKTLDELERKYPVEGGR